MSSRHRGLSRSEEERARLGAHPHGHRKPSSSGSSHRSRSAHSSSVAPEVGIAEEVPGRPLSANYALRPLPPPPSPTRYHFGCLLRSSLPPMPSSLVEKINCAGSRASHHANSKGLPSGEDVRPIYP
ncbi:unnamed protein product [Hydatigera taeniaeformis]|uniref:Uncharacterized protein n=1 Tax=Hydatigena taeniaeformis TaxID=6205 RepID=A0A0R3WKR5_HYDTA|nr:unnamed protein product [Hydatigera taeniaeformis]